jgi:hypothetical protein
VESSRADSVISGPDNVKSSDDSVEARLDSVKSWTDSLESRIGRIQSIRAIIVYSPAKLLSSIDFTTNVERSAIKLTWYFVKRRYVKLS